MATATLIFSKRWTSVSVWLVYAIGLVPAAWSFYLGATGGLGADPVKSFELLLGLWTLRFLILTLAVSPLRELGGWSFLRYRRALGLLTFYYAAMHFTVYAVLDQTLMLDAIIADVLKRPFIMFGMAGLVLLVPLAVTSNAASIRTLGPNWIKLHRLVYIVAALGVLHFALSTKVLSLEQYIYIGLILLLILYRAVRPILREPKRKLNRPRRA
ncbi:protein-methionine-sulfoxide reductase heme-binding subunit MsrQ [Rhizobium sp. YJ-22]|uniref:protein-methionine-sulfoxide reductase heme-binding subunit MsrQ n=1 Tax=Rhizobium sp. YJ-22 TaxID=3037556 RepID=UPI002412B2CF|nr:protein-methionine-sulfoxide reductase heme-binding subunit MsrQ [Rhizobium sp. YJ-22]MDG3576985.1 protein-methionine-sulfoxide reductase heme-binding subunit MsrQ [Rhizobium sp. YJ-22]